MNEGKEIRFIDLFSGIGGFRLGLERANQEEGASLEGTIRNSLRSRGDSPYPLLEGNGEDRRECSNYFGLEGANNRMEKDGMECCTAPRSCSKSQTFSTSKEKRAGHFRSARARSKIDAEAWSGKGLGDSGGRSEPQPQGGGGWTQQSSCLNYRCVWSCDNNKYANQVYTKQFGEANHYSGDIRGVDPGDIPDFDLLCAGFPCQSFSVAGPRTGFQDTRGTLFFEISRIAEAKRPQILLLENVKGLLSSDRGQTFKTILQELGRIGYWAEWQILNSKHHGVPQNRERVFIIGHLRNGRSRSIFPIGETDEVADKNGRRRSPVQAEVSTAIDGSYYKGVDRHGQRTVVLDTFNKGGIKEEEAYPLKTNPSRTSSAVIAVLTPDRAEKRQHGRRFKEPGDPSFTLTGQDIHGVAISFTNPHDSEEERKVNLSDTSRTVKPPYGNQQPLILHNIYGGFKEDIRTFEEHSPTIRTAKGGGHIPSVMIPIGSDKPTVRAGGKGSLDRHAWDTLTDGFRIRRLTPVECERLQGFPDGWTEWGIDENGEKVKISDTQRYKMLGNAVTTNVITFLGRKIMEAESNG